VEPASRTSTAAAPPLLHLHDEVVDDVGYLLSELAEHHDAVIGGDRSYVNVSFISVALPFNRARKCSSGCFVVRDVDMGYEAGHPVELFVWCLVVTFESLLG
jgi:hypothetical protein